MVTFKQFVSALVYPQQRALIGLVISDADAEALLSNRQWAENYHRQWLALGQQQAGS